MKKIIPAALLLSASMFIMLGTFSFNAHAQIAIYEIAEKKGKWGVKSGSEWKVQPVYEKIAYRSFPSQLGKQYAYFAWVDGKIDLYAHYGLGLLYSKFPVEDSVHLGSFVECYYYIYPFVKNGLCGWKYQQSVIPAQFDSIRAVFDYKNAVEQVKVYKNGTLALMDKSGAELVPAGNYTDLGLWWVFFSKTYLKDAKTGQLLEGLYFDKTREIPPRYTKIELITSVTVDDLSDYLRNEKITSFYYCELPDGNCDCYVVNDSSMEKLPAELQTAYCRNRAESEERERNEKAAQLKADAERKIWLKGLKLFTKGGTVGIKDASGKIILPATATALVIGKWDIDPDSDTIKFTREIEDNYSIDWKFNWAIPLQFDTAVLTMGELMQHKIMAELNPYNSITGDYKLYFDIEITPQYDYTASIYKFHDNCPLCEGSGQLRDGYTYTSETFTYERTVKDGTTTITRKNYLANERVSSNGTVYVPEYTQTYDNYKTVQEEKTVTTATKKYKTCTLCEGKKRYSSCSIEWDKERNEYVLKNIWF